MREIKYKYWDGEFKQMCNVRAIVWHNGIVANIDLFDKKALFRNPNMFYDHALLQYTTRMDRNGVEIYEGDVVQFQYANLKKLIIAEVRWGLAGWGLLGRPGEGWWPSRYLLDSRCIVIGNIYENPDLLES